MPFSRGRQSFFVKKTRRFRSIGKCSIIPDGPHIPGGKYDAAGGQQNQAENTFFPISGLDKNEKEAIIWYKKTTSGVLTPDNTSA